jgi:hypothetical protein
MERWLVECEVCGRTFEVGGVPPTRSSMGPHDMLGPDGDAVIAGSRCIGSDRPGTWTSREAAHSSEGAS